ncbi:patatin-like phospholipase family protein [Mycolicibacterium sp. ND9-15]|uniref:patatin-like phospholipase family protein n=1 Tax=Mycolicibacterium sp. ND9-15 TaxID=3042320 RepID=UPI002DD93BC1|nr:patatin-like phospholipase family protein [Mycolicibacterium sp. ND9-15]WSE55197.1 patatin-like phospholipase family protein [Mycolicibacterium sp. ND9-15]
MTTAFVLSGGASLGAVQVGMLRGLADAGTTPDLIIGTSVGALNGGWISSRPDRAGVDALADLWASLSRNDVFPTRPILGLLGFLGRRPNLLPDSGLRRLLTDHLEFSRLEDAPIPLHVVATDVLSGHDVLLSSGDAIDAILASAAIPAAFPPVKINGRYLIDGGVVNNTPLSHAIALGADRVWVLPTGYSCALSKPPKGALAMGLHALNLAINQRLAVDIARFEGSVDLRVIPQPCPIGISPVDFSHSAELVERSHTGTREWLAKPRPTTGQAALLAPHRH